MVAHELLFRVLEIVVTVMAWVSVLVTPPSEYDTVIVLFPAARAPLGE